MKRRGKILLAAAGVIILILTVLLVSLLTTPFEKDYCAENTASGSKQIAITFDDGPGKYTEQLLDGLRERDVKVSFFLMGRKAEKHTELVQTMYEDGHLVGSHTYSHINFFKSDFDTISQELERTDAILEGITGEKPRFFRPPYGYYTPFQLNKIDKIAVLWSETPRDWVHIDEDYICDYIVEHAKDGQIILVHDTKDATVPAVLRAIDVLKEQGYEFVRVDELLCRNGESLAPGLAYRFCADGKRTWFF